MKKVVLTFGLLAGGVVAVLVWVVAWLCESDLIAFERMEFVGYASMLIALSMVFFGIKSYRDNYGNGKITFWKGMQVGLLISLIAGVLYFAGALSYNIVNPGFQAKFIQKYTEFSIGKLQSRNAPQAEIDSAKAEIDLMQKLFENPFLFFAIAMVEILPVGIIVSLISAGLLRKKDVLPAAV
ncbi:MAG: hypothetical protein DMF63_12140 [Acidobacteria bacterium]|nr:MAG: hypothetical protein DMF63_12140 [Acidobacteriota bacterium]